MLLGISKRHQEPGKSQLPSSMKENLHTNWTVVIQAMKNYPKNISALKKGEAKKVQVTERLKDVISL